ncbi:hypothetical protein KR76_00044 [Pimelobacter simplex]|uniref:Uncharacterized protein n=1 Tax=Nocardioides simplex TaxID=2045 RepID=A0A0C5XA53_NOCSI|nr:hypothetical protein KR76_00044 [Pimelobacter simplex]
MSPPTPGAPHRRVSLPPSPRGRRPPRRRRGRSLPRTHGVRPEGS